PRVGPQPDLRRARHRVDCLRGPRRRVHVRGVFPGDPVRVAALGGGARRGGAGGASRDRGPPLDHFPHPRKPPGQPALGHRRAALLPPVLHDAPLDHRPPVAPPEPADPPGRGDVHPVHAPARLRRRGPRRAGPLPLPHAHVYGDGDPGGVPGSGGDAADGRRSAACLRGHLGGRRRDGGGGGGAADHPVSGPSVLRRRVRSPHVHDLRAGRAREHGRRLRRVVHPERDHLVRRRAALHRDGIRAGLRALHRPDVRAAGRDPRQAGMTRPRALAALLMVLIAALPLVPMGGMRQYALHVLVQIFIWSFIAGAWSLMGRFRPVSLGHGAFLGIGAYTSTLLWNVFGQTPWAGGLAAVAGDVAAAASVGIDVTRFKLGITALSAALTAGGGVLYAQYITYVSPETLSGIGVSLRIVFAAVLGGMYSLLGPTVGTALTIALSEYLRVTFGIRLIGMAETIYGLALILLIIFLPVGLYGGLEQVMRRAGAVRPGRRMTFLQTRKG